MTKRISQYQCAPYIRRREEFTAPHLRGIWWADNDYRVIHYSTTIVQCLNGAWIMNETTYSSMTAKIQNYIRYGTWNSDGGVWTPSYYKEEVVHLYKLPYSATDLVRYIQGTIALDKLYRNMINMEFV